MWFSRYNDIFRGHLCTSDVRDYKMYIILTFSIKYNDSLCYSAKFVFPKYLNLSINLLIRHSSQKNVSGPSLIDVVKRKNRERHKEIKKRGTRML